MIAQSLSHRIGIGKLRNAVLACGQWQLNQVVAIHVPLNAPSQGLEQANKLVMFV
jgi:hypothetical protein